MPINGMGPSQFRGVAVQAGVFPNVTVTVPSTATGVNSLSSAVTLPGVQAGDFVSATPAAAGTGGVSFDAVVTAASTVVVTVNNGSASTYNPATVVLSFYVMRAKVG